MEALNGDIDSQDHNSVKLEPLHDGNSTLELDSKTQIKCSCDFCNDNKDSYVAGGDSSEDELTCELCREKFETTALLKRHHFAHGLVDPKTWFQCEHCEKSFMYKKGLHSHQRQHKTQTIRRSLRPTKQTDRLKIPHFRCDKCEKIFRDEIQLAKHEKIHSGITFKCDHCSRIFSVKELLVKHIQNIHIPNPGIPCNICGIFVENKATLVAHMKNHKSLRSLCEVCGKTVSSAAYSAHKRMHKEAMSEETFLCDICQKPFTNRGSLRCHKTVHHGTIRFTCEFCGKQFTTLTLMKHHQQIHTGNRDHACPVCGKAFTLKVTLKSHMRIHTGEMPYMCNNCGHRFTWKTTYRKHVENCEVKNHKSVPAHFAMQDLPIDYSEDNKNQLPIDYSEDTKWRPMLVNFTEDVKYRQDQISFGEDIKYESAPIDFSDETKYNVNISDIKLT